MLRLFQRAALALKSSNPELSGRFQLSALTFPHTARCRESTTYSICECAYLLLVVERHFLPSHALVNVDSDILHLQQKVALFCTCSKRLCVALSLTTDPFALLPIQRIVNAVHSVARTLCLRRFVFVLSLMCHAVSRRRGEVDKLRDYLG